MNKSVKNKVTSKLIGYELYICIKTNFGIK